MKESPDFSPVPYFLLCRAIELQFKAVHLEQLKAGHPGHQTQYDVKKLFNHKLIKSYEALPATDRTLSREQLKLLKKADEIYKGKGFEYVDIDQCRARLFQLPRPKGLGRTGQGDYDGAVAPSAGLARLFGFSVTCSSGTNAIRMPQPA